AWMIALGACLFSGALEVVTAFLGRWIQRNVPRAALLGTVAGLALTFIAGEMLFNTFEVPVIGLVSLAIIIIGFIGKISMPFKIPASLFAIITGTILAFVLGHQNLGSISD